MAKAPTKSPNNSIESTHTIGIIGGGIAGSTIALRLAGLGLSVALIENGPSLVNGPPICHLHAGGNLYREISQQQCITLLKQSIEILRLYPKAADYRPTVIAVPRRDRGTPEDLFPRLQRLQREYQLLIDQDPANQVLGAPCDYFKLFSRLQLESLAQQSLVTPPTTLEHWLIPVAKSLDLDQLQFPVVMVQEYGLSVFRLAATASLALENLPNCNILTNQKVTSIKQQDQQWQLTLRSNTNVEKKTHCSYLINACGFRTGVIDDLVGEKRQRMVEFKAAYVTHWPSCDAIWPEVIFYGERGTPNGMAQLTPYPGNYFQIHGMTQDITLFKQGLVANTATSAQPQLSDKYLNKIDQQWPSDVALNRTNRSIDFMSHFIPSFSSANMGGKPLFGAQQIPGDDPELRAADVSFSDNNYARCEIVKASSALTAADQILEKLLFLQLIGPSQITSNSVGLTTTLTEHQISERAKQLTKERGYPIELAMRNTNET